MSKSGKENYEVCDECFRLSNGHICEGLDHCRISEKTEEQLKYVLSSAKKDTFLRACAGSGKTEVVEKYVRLLDSMGCKEYDNKILVKQNTLRKQLEKTTQNEFDTKEPLVVAVQLWKEKAQSQMSMALELSGLQEEKQKSLCHKRQREKKKLMRYFEVFLFLFPTLFPTCYN